MKILIAILLFGICLCSCHHRETKSKSVINKDSLKREELRATIINDPMETHWIIKGKYRFWMPEKHQMDAIDSIIVQAIKERQRNFYRHLKVDSFRSYYKQYVCFIDSTGDSMVFMNATCVVPRFPVFDSIFTHPMTKRFDWQHHLLEVEDGGDCYWRIYINWTIKKCIEFSVNGEA
jgi:hypothetical protein